MNHNSSRSLVWPILAILVFLPACGNNTDCRDQPNAFWASDDTFVIQAESRGDVNLYVSYVDDDGLTRRIAMVYLDSLWEARIRLSRASQVAYHFEDTRGAAFVDPMAAGTRRIDGEEFSLFVPCE